MEDKLVSLETAKLAKKKEFNEICQYYYEILDKPINLQKMSCSNAEGYKQPTAPTQSLLAKWLREEHNIHIVISNNNYNKLLNWSFDLHKLPVGIIQMWKRGDDTYNTFEEAYEIGLQEALKLI